MAQKKDGTTTQVTCRVPVDVAMFFQEQADAQERSLSWVVSKARQQYVSDVRRNSPGVKGQPLPVAKA